MRFKVIAMVIGLLAVLVSARVAAAHTPIFVERDITTPEQAWPVGDYAISWAFYGRVTPAGAPQYFAIDGRAGERLYATLEVPEIDGLQEFRPSLALIGPGLPAFDAPPGVTLPTEFGGVRVDDARSAPRARFDEPYSRTSYYRGPVIDLPLPADGRYYVIVFDESGATGKYTLAIGTREVFGGGDPNWTQKLRTFFGSAGQDPAGQVPTPQPESTVERLPPLPVFLPMWYKS
jgi:hypothetical protein